MSDDWDYNEQYVYRLQRVLGLTEEPLDEHGALAVLCNHAAVRIERLEAEQASQALKLETVERALKAVVDACDLPDEDYSSVERAAIKRAQTVLSGTAAERQGPDLRCLDVNKVYAHDTIKCQKPAGHEGMHANGHIVWGTAPCGAAIHSEGRRVDWCDLPAEHDGPHHIPGTVVEGRLTEDELFIEIRAICDRTGWQTSDMVKALGDIEAIVGAAVQGHERIVCPKCSSTSKDDCDLPHNCGWPDSEGLSPAVERRVPMGKPITHAIRSGVLIGDPSGGPDSEGQRPVYVGVDFAKPGSDETVFRCNLCGWVGRGEDGCGTHVCTPRPQSTDLDRQGK